MPDPIFADPRLAAIYDAFDAPCDDLDAYVALAEELGSRRIVHLGCGTGSLALRLATGREVVGIDPARASLDVARAKPGAGAITWIDGDAAAIPTGRPADLVLMTGNAAQAVIDDHAWSALLRHVHAALAPGGCFVVESRRPEQRAWQEWDSSTAVTAHVPSIGTVEQHTGLVAVELPLVPFRGTYRFLADATTIVSDSTIRFRGRDELEHDLRDAGFTVRDVREAPDRPGREFVVIAEGS